jgi:transposase
MVELVRADRSPYELSKKFEPTVVTISSWVKRGELDEDHRADGPTTDERNNLARLRRENKQLQLEREILAHRPYVLLGKAATWFVRETDSIPPESSSS